MIIVLSLVVASLLVAGCTSNTSSTASSPTPTPTTDLLSYYTKIWEGNGKIIERNFTKSTNVRGNDEYTGIVRNTSLPQGSGVTTVIELTKSQSESKQLYDKAVADKQAEGFSYRSDEVTRMDPTHQNTGLWAGSLGYRWFYIFYRYNTDINSWELITETS